uniref:Uncharacterized protein n=1 Tax=Rhizophora mucronata TaxID=61149 RepID=A0A2P2QLT4_RHIMU
MCKNIYFVPTQTVSIFLRPNPQRTLTHPNIIALEQRGQWLLETPLQCNSHPLYKF